MSVPRLPERAPIGDLGVDQDVELARRRLHPPPRRALAAEHAQQVVAGVVRERLLEQAGGVDRARLRAVRVQPEQRAHRDAHRQVAGPVVEVGRRAGHELLDRPLGLLEDRLDRGGDALAVEGGQHDPPRLAMEVAVDRQQPVAHQPDQVAEAALRAMSKSAACETSR